MQRKSVPNLRKTISAVGKREPEATTSSGERSERPASAEVVHALHYSGREQHQKCPAAGVDGARLDRRFFSRVLLAARIRSASRSKVDFANDFGYAYKRALWQQRRLVQSHRLPVSLRVQRRPR